MGFIPSIKGWFTVQKSISIIHYINRLKKKNHVIISIAAGKALDKTQHLFIIKTSNRGELPHLDKEQL